MLDLEYTRDRIHQYRRENNLTQAAFAELLGISLNHAGALERGDREPSLHMFFKLADQLGITADELAGNSLSKSALPEELQNASEKEWDTALQILHALARYLRTK